MKLKNYHIIMIGMISLIVIISILGYTYSNTNTKDTIEQSTSYVTKTLFGESEVMPAENLLKTQGDPTADSVEVADPILKEIYVDKTKDVMIENVKYKLIYDEKPPIQIIKCVCEKKIGCKIKECLE